MHVIHAICKHHTIPYPLKNECILKSHGKLYRAFFKHALGNVRLLKDVLSK